MPAKLVQCIQYSAASSDVHFATLFCVLSSSVSEPYHYETDILVGLMLRVIVYSMLKRVCAMVGGSDIKKRKEELALWHSSDLV